MKDASPEEKKELGAKLSELKNALNTAYAKKDSELSILEINAQLEQDIVDISVNAKKYE
jgi:phenylalanyl-tRNA synthetase alpha subunit